LAYFAPEWVAYFSPDYSTAFDTETATSDPVSICQIGFVAVRNGQITLKQSYLIQPPGNAYNARNSCIHGIDACRTGNQPLFPDVWMQIEPYFINTLLVAHNAAFDLKVLNAVLAYYNLNTPEFRCDCTYRMSRLSLKALSESLQIEMERHHDALSDALTCAKAYMLLNQGIVPDLLRIRETAGHDPFAGHTQLSGSILKPDFENVADKNNPFFAKKVVFTGVLQLLPREEAAGIIQKMGADIDTSVTKRTDYVIVGYGAGPKKLKKIDELNANGSSIRIIQEDEFLSML
ncbi:MAG TPA: exonuclease domain-containing protein, partial [Lentimicrobium sp.]|nr:exonuclease domain-containing protein [Lentimicrobium sp.]